jgi:hypothetical protein
MCPWVPRPERVVYNTATLASPSPAPEQDWAQIQAHYDSGPLLDDRTLEDNLCLLQHHPVAGPLPASFDLYLDEHASKFVHDDDRALEYSPFRNMPFDMSAIRFAYSL